MTDPLGLVGQSGGVHGPARPNAPGPNAPAPPQQSGNADFKKLLLDQLKEVNDLEQEAQQAVEDLATGKRSDYEAVMTATRKAEMATQMLLQLRNKVQTAYDEVKQIRV